LGAGFEERHHSDQRLGEFETNVGNPVLSHFHKRFIKVLCEELSAKLDSSLATEEQEELTHGKGIAIGQLVKHSLDQVVTSPRIILV